MIQDIIAYSIIGLAVAYTVNSVVKIFVKKSNRTSCHDCNCCVKKKLTCKL